MDFIVVEAKMYEVLLGRPFLKHIGFNLKENLEGVGSIVDGRNFYDLEPEKINAATLTYSGMVYGANV